MQRWSFTITSALSDDPFSLLVPLFNSNSDNRVLTVHVEPTEIEMGTKSKKHTIRVRETPRRIIRYQTYTLFSTRCTLLERLTAPVVVPPPRSCHPATASSFHSCWDCSNYCLLALPSSPINKLFARWNCPVIYSRVPFSLIEASSILREDLPTPLAV